MKHMTKLTFAALIVACAVGCSREEPEVTTSVTPVPDRTSEYVTTETEPVNPPPAAASTQNETTIGEMTSTNAAGTSEVTESGNDLAANSSPPVVPPPSTGQQGVDASGAAGAPAATQAGQGTGGSQLESARKSSDYIDFAVVDTQSEKIGTVEVIWDDANDLPAYLGVKTSGEDKLIVVPAEEAQVNHTRKMVRLNLRSQTLSSAPKVDEDAELDQATREKIALFYLDHDQQRGNQAAAQTQDEATIRLKEEQANVGKRTVQSGGVILKKVVRTETNQVPVTLRHEELTIQRVPGQDKELGDSARFTERDVYIPLRREVPVVDKDVALKETVRVGKDVEKEQEEIKTRLREEALKIERQGQVEGAGASGGVSSGTGSQSSSEQQQDQPQQ